MYNLYIAWGRSITDMLGRIEPLSQRALAVSDSRLAALCDLNVVALRSSRVDGEGRVTVIVLAHVITVMTVGTVGTVLVML